MARPTVQKQLSDENSLLNEIKKLISIRKANRPLQSLGKIEFICNGTVGKPLAYIRSFDNEMIFAAINPSNNSSEIKINGNFDEVIYCFGNGADIHKNKCIIHAGSAVFAKLI